MKKAATVVLVIYSLAMVSYGSLEIGHDLLHYLASHHHSHLHDHSHSHEHNFSDHQHDHHHHTHIDLDQEDEPSPEVVSLINFFLFYESRPLFSFTDSAFNLLNLQVKENISACSILPATPPPQS